MDIGVVGGQVELAQDVGDVFLDGAFGQDERLGDRVVRRASSDQLQHLELAGGEPVEYRGGPLPARRDEHVHDPRDEHRSALRGRDAGVPELREVADALLEQLHPALRSAVEQPERVVRLDVLGQHHHPDVRVGARELLRGPDPLVRLGRGHPDVGQDDIGSDRLDGIQQGR